MRTLDIRHYTVLLMSVPLLAALIPGCGRSLSRWGIGSQHLKAPAGAQQVLGISFHSDGTSTIKDVTFVMNDCTVVAKEYKDISPFEGVITFVDSNGNQFKQAGCIPR